MPLTPTDPALLQDLVPPPPQLLAAPRGRSASIQVGRKRTYTADADAYGGPALKAPRGRSRTRFHPSPGHAGIPRDLAQEGWHPITPTSNADARASSRAMQLASEPPTCNEEPPYWTTGPGVDPLKSIDEETIHSAPVQPCSRTEAHGNVPFYVCASCRIRAGKHREEQFFMLGHQPRSLPLCEACGTYGLTMPANPANVENGQVTKLGCTCGTDWMCYECALRDLEVAQAKYDGELEFRRNLGSVDVQGGVQYVSIETHCICGEPLKGTERAWRCTCCLGIGIS